MTMKMSEMGSSAKMMRLFTALKVVAVTGVAVAVAMRPSDNLSRQLTSVTEVLLVVTVVAVGSFGAVIVNFLV